jgi:hypothetical protein
VYANQQAASEADHERTDDDWMQPLASRISGVHLAYVGVGMA